MRKTLLFILFIIISSFKLFSLSPFISYIIPDIGSPGMNTYIEIISHKDSIGSFGTDGFYLNNPTDNIRIECLNPLDRRNVIFGPIVVSWNGRMISTQVFIRPNLDPKIWDWCALKSAFRIPVRVYVNENYSNIDSIYIVQPFAFGDKSSLSDTILGGGNLGRRSRRGAMIVDSMILANATYTVSTNDCDPSTNGNQGYLPFVLISKGSITGTGTGTKISVDGSTRNAGPGGGGGGGAVCDIVLGIGPTGEDGGNGFTGGGPGGANNSGFTGKNSSKTPGVGSGSNQVNSLIGGASLNGVPGGTLPWYEASGGGTGHPFGTSGTGCNSGDGCDPFGGYGGGSGYRQQRSGGSGGYAIDGKNSDGPTLNYTGGKAYGNVMGVPLAGGSGGASGDPQSGYNCSGSGGGGGGAICFYSKKIFNVNLSALGGIGPSNYGDGGGGSGGLIVFQTKLSTNSINLDVTGGKSGVTFDAGSYGRMRVDAPGTFPGKTPAAANIYQGISSDTSSWVFRNDTITGSYQSGRNLRFFLKTESNTNWTEIFGVKTVGSSWQLPITFSKPDSLFFFVVIQDVPNPSTTAYLMEPAYIMSQAAANLLRINKIPQITGDSVISFHVINCVGKSYQDTAYFLNNGEANLQLNLNAATFKYGNRGFSLSPNSQKIILPGSKDSIYISYTYQAGQRGTIRDTLIIPHNDIYSNHYPWKIALEAIIDSIALEKWNIELTQKLNSLNMGNICLLSTKDTTIAIKNVSKDSTITIKTITTSNSSLTASLLGGAEMIPNDTAKVKLSFFGSSRTFLSGYVYFTIAECPSFKDSILVTIIVVNGRLQIPDTLDLGKVCVGNSKDSSFSLKNINVFDIDLDNPQLNDKINFSFNLNGSSHLKSNESTRVNVRFIANSEGKFITKLYFSMSQCPGFNDSTYLVGTGVTAGLKFVGNANFKDTRVSETDTLTLKLVNNGDGDAYIQTPYILQSPFRVLDYTPPLPVTLKKNDTLMVRVEFRPTFPPKTSDTIFRLFSNLILPNACPDTAEITLHGKGVEPKLILLDSLVFDSLPYCLTQTDSVIMKNIGDGFIKSYMPANINGPDARNFIITKQPALPFTLNTGDSAVYYIKFIADSGDYGIKIAYLYIQTDYYSALRVVKLIGYKEKLNMNYPATIDFGNVPIGTIDSLNFTITNNSKIAYQVVNVISFNPDISTSPKTAILLALGGNQQFQIKWKITKSGPNEDSIKIVSDYPCRDTITIKLTANGLEGAAFYPSMLQFDTLFYCQEQIDSVPIINMGVASFDIMGLSIQGTDKSLFSLEFIYVYPARLQPKDTFMVHIRFKPGNSPWGLKQAELSIRTNLSANPDPKIALYGFKDTLRVAHPDTVYFGKVPIGMDTSITVTLQNLNANTAQIFSTGNDVPYIIASFVSLPVAIAPYIGTVNCDIHAVFKSPAKTVSKVFLYFDKPCKDTIIIFVVGQGAEGKPDFTPSLDFGSLQYCENKVDSVMIYNHSKARFDLLELKVQGTDASLFTILDNYSMPRTMNAGDSIACHIKFAPDGSSIGIKNAELYVRTNISAFADTIIKLTGEKIPFNVTSFPSTLNFGAKKVGKSNTITFHLNNHGIKDEHFFKINSNNSDINAAPQSGTIAADGGEDSIAATLNFTKLGLISDTLFVIFDLPCADTLKIPFIGTGIEGAVDYDNLVDFGRLLPCESKILPVKITYTGTDPQDSMVIIGMDITGTDSNLFALAGGSFPVTVLSGITYTQLVKFSPSVSSDGIKYANLIIHVLINNKETAIIASLTGERYSGLLAVPESVNFGSVVIGNTSSKVVVLKNTGQVAISIDSILPFNLSLIFHVYPINFKTILLPGDSIKLTILFTPYIEQQYTDTLKLRLMLDTCETYKFIELYGKGVVAKKLKVWIPYMEPVTPGYNKFYLPIYAKSDKPEDSIEIKKATISLMYNPTVFYATSLSKGRIVDDTIINDPMMNKWIILTIFVDSSTIITASDSLLTNIIGYVLLGNEDSTDVEFTAIGCAFPPNSNVPKTTTQNGNIAVKICREGGDRLISQKPPLSLLLSPVPADNEINLEIQTMETGKHSVEISTLEGAILLANEWNVALESNKLNYITINTSKLANGMYFVILKSPSRKLVQPVYIVK